MPHRRTDRPAKPLRITKPKRPEAETAGAAAPGGPSTSAENPPSVPAAAEMQVVGEPGFAQAAPGGPAPGSPTSDGPAPGGPAGSRTAAAGPADTQPLDLAADAVRDGADQPPVEPTGPEAADPATRIAPAKRVAAARNRGPRKQGAKAGKRPIRRGRVVLALVLVAVVGAAVCAGLFCWQKWWRFDDTADIQGQWKVLATGDTIVLDSRNMKLTTSISYEYRLDTDAKTISYSFGKVEGGGHYYFSGSRDTLVIIDGDEHLGLLAELGFLPEETLASDTATDNMTVLSKVSDDTSAEPSSTGNGLSSGQGNRGEREFVVKPEQSSSSSSGESGSSSGSSGAGLADGGQGDASADDGSGARGPSGTRSRSATYGEDDAAYGDSPARSSRSGALQDDGAYSPWDGDDAYGYDEGNAYDDSYDDTYGYDGDAGYYDPYADSYAGDTAYYGEEAYG